MKHDTICDKITVRKQVSVTLKADEYAALQRLANKRGSNPSRLAREFVLKLLKEEKELE